MHAWMGFVDASISAQTLVLAAEAEGLRSCYNGNVVDRANEVSELLKLPEHVVPAFMLTLGYPRSNGQRSRKYSYDVIVHRETYHDMGMEELYPHHLAKCGTPQFVANDARCAQLKKCFCGNMARSLQKTQWRACMKRDALRHINIGLGVIIRATRTP